MTETQEKQLQTNLERLSEAIGRGAVKSIRQTLRALHPAELARLLEALPRSQRRVIWQLVPLEDEGDVLVHLNEEVRNDLIALMSTEDLVAAITVMPIDDLTEVVRDLPERLTEQILEAMSKQDRERLETALQYEEDTAGGIMSTDTTTVRPDVTADVTLRYLRGKQNLPERTYQVFVVNRYGRYLGAIPLAKLIVASPDQELSELLDPDTLRIPVHMPVHEVADLFSTHAMASAAVVDDSGFLLGRITVDDVIDVIREQAEHSVMARAGLNEDTDMFAPVWTSTRRRAIWLGINLATAFLAAWVVGIFEATIKEVVALAVLMPVVASMGGIAGTQTLTLITRGIALGQVGRSNAWWLAIKEITVGVVNGALWAGVVAAIAYLWFRSFWIAAVIAIAMVVNLVAAAVCGVAVPLTLKRFGIDPALAGGVVLTTVTDVIGFFALLGLGKLLLT